MMMIDIYQVIVSVYYYYVMIDVSVDDYHELGILFDYHHDDEQLLVDDFDYVMNDEDDDGKMMNCENH
jgi:hypothetical protein